MTNISKLLPACGFAIGAALVAVTSAFKEAPKNKSGDPMFTFEYHAPGGTDYTPASVQDVANWRYTSSPDPCLGSTKACTLEVPQDYVDNPDTPGVTPTLDGSIDIETGGTTTTAYVQSTAAGSSATIDNQPE